MDVLEYLDPVEGFRGWAAISRSQHRLAVGGLRVQQDLCAETLISLAEAMTLKERLLGLCVDGAKAGIDYDNLSPGKHEALVRFLRFLRRELDGRLSLGPDMGVTWDELERAAGAVGLVSAKAAVARAQGLATEDFQRRLACLNSPVGALTLAERRAGHALAHCALAAARWVLATGQLRAGIQGFGTLGRGAAVALVEAGAQVTAVADETGCLVNDDGLDVEAMLNLPLSQPVTEGTSAFGSAEPGEVLLHQPADVLVLAAREDAVSPREAASLPVRAVAVGANLGLSSEVEEILHQRGVVVVPDFVGGCGGSASMDALFGLPSCPEPAQVLDQIALRMRALVHQILTSAAEQGVPPRQAALAISEENRKHGTGRPYGRWGESGTEPGAAVHAGSAT